MPVSDIHLVLAESVGNGGSAQCFRCPLLRYRLLMDDDGALGGTSFQTLILRAAWTVHSHSEMALAAACHAAFHALDLLALIGDE